MASRSGGEFECSQPRLPAYGFGGQYGRGQASRCVALLGSPWRGKVWQGMAWPGKARQGLVMVPRTDKPGTGTSRPTPDASQSLAGISPRP